MADIEDFDLDKTTADAWTDFTARLDEVLSVMDSTSDLTISVARSGATHDIPPAIRFSVVRPGVVEATLLGPAVDGLATLGWVAHPDGTLRVERDQEQTAALASVTTTTMADALGVLHPVFLEPDQLAEILTPTPLPEAPTAVAGEFGVVMPTSQTQLDDIVDAELEQAYGHPALRNAEGDVAIRVGSTVVFLRSTPDCQELVLFAALVHDVSGRSRACEVLNDLNVESRYCRFALHRDRVFVQVSVAAKPFVPAHLHQALQSISSVADGIDDELASRLSGRTTFPG